MKYKVCDNDAFTDVFISGAILGAPVTRSYVNGSCRVLETTDTFQITADKAVDLPYTIFYTYDYDESNDRITEPTRQIHQTTTMSAGQTVKNITVVTIRISTCS